MADEATPAPELAANPGAALAADLAVDVARLERELAEIELLVGQARTEADRHEQRRAQLAERSVTLAAAGSPDLAEIIEQSAQLLALTRRAAVMESQIEVLEGKRNILLRYRDALERIRDAVAAAGIPAAEAPGSGEASEGDAATAPGALPQHEPPPGPQALARLVLTAQEDLRRDIARAMHDGPAQSLTNIILQAQIVERLMERDPATARAELHELVATVQRTLEATKTFIFDVRPMVLDDLGLVPTLRRVARDRGRRGAVPVEFDSLGPDRRLPMEVESAVFRIVDEAVTALVATKPEKVLVGLDWADGELEARVAAVHPIATAAPAGEPEATPSPDLPPALAAFLADRPSLRPVSPPTAPPAGLPAEIRREIAQRAASIGARVTMSPNGREVRVVVTAPEVALEAGS